MKASRNTVWVTGIVGLLSLSFCLLIEFCLGSEAFAHADFYASLALNIFAGALLSLITALIQYFRLRNEHFFRINADFNSIWHCVSSPLAFSLSKTYLPSNIKRFEQAHENQQDMALRMNDFHTFFRHGFRYNQVKGIHDLTLRPEYVFWGEFDNAVSDDDYLKSFEKAHKKYEEIKNDFDKLKDDYDAHIEKLLKQKWRKSFG